jgi:ATP phosphoribosyltransferase
MIKVAVPNKGVLSEPAIDLLKTCGYKASKFVKSLNSADCANGV